MEQSIPPRGQPTCQIATAVWGWELGAHSIRDGKCKPDLGKGCLCIWHCRAGIISKECETDVGTTAGDCLSAEHFW